MKKSDIPNKIFVLAQAKAHSPSFSLSPTTNPLKMADEIEFVKKTAVIEYLRKARDGQPKGSEAYKAINGVLDGVRFR